MGLANVSVDLWILEKRISFSLSFYNAPVLPLDIPELLWKLLITFLEVTIEFNTSLKGMLGKGSLEGQIFNLVVGSILYVFLGGIKIKWLADFFKSMLNPIIMNPGGFWMMAIAAFLLTLIENDFNIQVLLGKIFKAAFKNIYKIVIIAAQEKTALPKDLAKKLFNLMFDKNILQTRSCLQLVDKNSAFTQFQNDKFNPLMRKFVGTGDDTADKVSDGKEHLEEEIKKECTNQKEGIKERLKFVMKNVFPLSKENLYLLLASAVFILVGTLVKFALNHNLFGIHLDFKLTVLSATIYIKIDLDLSWLGETLYNALLALYMSLEKTVELLRKWQAQGGPGGSDVWGSSLKIFIIFFVIFFTALLIEDALNYILEILGITGVFKDLAVKLLAGGAGILAGLIAGLLLNTPQAIIVEVMGSMLSKLVTNLIAETLFSLLILGLSVPLPWLKEFFPNITSL